MEEKISLKAEPLLLTVGWYLRGREGWKVLVHGELQSNLLIKSEKRNAIKHISPTELAVLSRPLNSCVC